MVFGNVNDENEIKFNVNSTENDEMREEYLYLLRFPLRPNALLRLLNDMNGY